MKPHLLLQLFFLFGCLLGNSTAPHVGSLSTSSGSGPSGSGSSGGGSSGSGSRSRKRRRSVASKSKSRAGGSGSDSASAGGSDSASAGGSDSGSGSRLAPMANRFKPSKASASIGSIASVGPVAGKYAAGGTMAADVFGSMTVAGNAMKSVAPPNSNVKWYIPGSGSGGQNFQQEQPPKVEPMSVAANQVMMDDRRELLVKAQISPGGANGNNLMMRKVVVSKGKTDLDACNAAFAGDLKFGLQFTIAIPDTANAEKQVTSITCIFEKKPNGNENTTAIIDVDSKAVTQVTIESDGVATPEACSRALNQAQAEKKLGDIDIGKLKLRINLTETINKRIPTSTKYVFQCHYETDKKIYV